MALFNDFLFWLHLLAIAAGGVATFGIPVVGRRMADFPAETRPLLFGIVKQFSSMGRGALAALVVTGPLLVWLKYGGVGGLNAWFWVKMALVVVFVAVIIYSGLVAARARKGDAAAMARMPLASAAGATLFVLIILAAVLSFS